MELSRIKILIVEDNAVSREMLRVLLELGGYRVLCAEDGGDAFLTAITEKPDLIITDVEMPNIDGFNFIRLLRKEPTTAHIPVIVFTAYTSIEKQSARQVGADDIAYKPINVDQLHNMIRHLLKPHA